MTLCDLYPYNDNIKDLKIYCFIKKKDLKIYYCDCHFFLPILNFKLLIMSSTKSTENDIMIVYRKYSAKVGWQNMNHEYLISITFLILVHIFVCNWGEIIQIVLFYLSKTVKPVLLLSLSYIVCCLKL